MCFLKNQDQFQINTSNLLNDYQAPMIKPRLKKDAELKESEDNQKEDSESFICPCHEKLCGFPWNHEQLSFINLFSMINTNNKMIENLNEVNKVLTKELTNVERQVQDQKKESANIKMEQQVLEGSTAHKQVEHSIKNKEIQLYAKLFQNFGGKKPIDQKYRLTVVGSIDHKLYKQRNFDIKVKLISNNEHEIIKNGNLLNVCIGVFNNDGEWVTENKTGKPILKGNTQIELYNGEAIFRKIFFREISSCFKGGKLNIVIYVKPSTIRYENRGLFSEHIEWNDIYPLFIRNVKVLSRKN